MNIDPNEYDVTICEICQYVHPYSWIDPSTYKTEHDTECVKGHKEVVKDECKDFKRRVSQND